MGKPIQKKWFGPLATAGRQINVTGAKWADGTTATNVYIVKQTGSNTYIVSNGTTKTEKLSLANATAVGGLTPGQCFITATPFNGSARPCKKIAQYRLDLFESDGSIKSYRWANVPANAIGQADLITASEGGWPVNTVAPAVTGTTTAGSTLTSTSGTWTGTPTITYSYQWTLNGTNVGTNATTYVIPAGGAGRLIVCKVTATNSVSTVVVNSNTVTTT